MDTKFTKLFGNDVHQLLGVRSELEDKRQSMMQALTSARSKSRSLDKKTPRSRAKH